MKKVFFALCIAVLVAGVAIAQGPADDNRIGVEYYNAGEWVEAIEALLPGNLSKDQIKFC